MLRSASFLSLALCSLSVVWAQEDQPAESPASGPAATDDSRGLDYWVEQLGHDHFLRREMATKQLVRMGPDAIEPLIAQIRNGELEVVERAMKVITAIALSRSPADDGGAWERLKGLATSGAGRVASSARVATEEVRMHRSEQARDHLASAGVFVGIDEFAIRAISRPRMLVQIDEKWKGDLDALQWLRWLDGVENARIKGPAVRVEVMEAVASVPGLKTLAIVDGSVDDRTLEPLRKLERIDSLEFRYVPLTDDQGDAIAKLPIRVSLNLMGTGISKQRVSSMKAELPGLQIDHRQGGFLGVTCLDSFNVCEINDVLPGSAAQEAGIVKGDVIVQVGEAEVSRFKDLQDAINQHVPGDEVEIKFERGGKVESVKLRLRKFEES